MYGNLDNVPCHGKQFPARFLCSNPVQTERNVTVLHADPKSLQSAPNPGYARTRQGSEELLQNRFSLGIAIALLITLLVGFSPTFFLRTSLHGPEIPARLYLHGVIGTAWYVLLVVQSSLIAGHRPEIHRRLGVLGVVLAVAVIAAGLQTSLGMIPRHMALGENVQNDLMRGVTAADYGSFITFTTFVSLGLWFRRRPDWHRRLMLLASISIIGTATSRISSWFGDVTGPINTVLLLGFFVAMIVADLQTRRRWHPVTAFGIPFSVAVSIGMQLSGIGAAVVTLKAAGHP
jgi:hypothetical protein